MAKVCGTLGPDTRSASPLRFVGKTNQPPSRRKEVYSQEKNKEILVAELCAILEDLDIVKKTANAKKHAGNHFVRLPESA